MHKNIKYKNKNISYAISGEGNVVVFLHGYIESLNVWDNFIELLNRKYKVITIDLPGHGNSEIFGEISTMSIMAEAVNAVLKEEQIKECVVIGHSMGGYVTMELVDQKNEKLKGFCLFHSSPFADSEEKKEVRDRLIKSIEQGKKIPLAKEHVEKTFSQENTANFIEEIGFLKIIAINTSDQGTIAALKGMKERKNYKESFEKTKLPSLLILGTKDNFIPPQIVDELTIPSQMEVKILTNSGHQGYIEEKAISLEIVDEFLRKIYL